MARYSEERKEAVLRKLLPPNNHTVAEVSREEGISEQTLYNWRKRIREEGKPVPGKTKTTEQWSGEAKLAAVIETASLNESELGAWCREKGLYPEQLRTWKQAFLESASQSDPLKKAEREEAKRNRKRVRQLEKELKRKEKALAEAAALLVLRKKLNAFYGEDSGED